MVTISGKFGYQRHHMSLILNSLLLLVVFGASLISTSIGVTETTAKTSSSSGVVLSSVNLKLSHIDPSSPPCVGPQCRSLKWLFRTQLLSNGPDAIEWRLRPNIMITPTTERSSEEVKRIMNLVGLRVSIQPDASLPATAISGTILSYDDATGQHVFARDDNSHQHLVPLHARTQLQHEAFLRTSGEDFPTFTSPTQTFPYTIHELQVPSTDSLDAMALSQSFLTWLALPSSSFIVNLNPSQPDLIIDRTLSSTRVGQILLEADLALKNETAFALHPDSAAGWEYWQLLDIPFPTPELCLNFRTWIVPEEEVEVIQVGDMLYLTSGALKVQEESDYLTTNFAYESTKDVTGCAAADPLVQREAEELFKQQALPRLIHRIQTADEFAPLRTIFYWRVIAEWYKRQPHAYLQPFHLDSESLQQHSPDVYRSMTEADGMAAATDVFQRYVATVRAGAYSVRKVHQLQDGRKFARTYAQGCIDWRDMNMTLTQQSSEDDESAEDQEDSSQSIRDRFLPSGATVYDVTEYGAIGDGVTDDGPAISKVVHMMLHGPGLENCELNSTTPAVILFFPTGNYLLLTMIGPSTEGFIQLSAPIDPSQNDCSIMILGSSLGTSSLITPNHTAVQIDGFQVTVANLTLNGTLLQNSAAMYYHAGMNVTGALSNITVMNVHFGYFGNELYIQSNNPSEGDLQRQVTVIDSSFMNATTFGIMVNDGTSLTVSSSLFYGANVGIDLDQALPSAVVQVDGCNFSSNVYAGIEIWNGSLVVTNSYFYGNSIGVDYDANNRYCQLIGNTFVNQSYAAVNNGYGSGPANNMNISSNTCEGTGAILQCFPALGEICINDTGCTIQP